MIAHYDYTAGVERKQYEGLRLAELSGLVDDKDIVLVLNKTPHVGGGCARHSNNVCGLNGAQRCVGRHLSKRRVP